MLFASKNVFNFTMASRRDDMISLCYLLIYLLDESQLKIINEVEGMAKKEKFKYIKKRKQEMTAKKLCGTQEKNPQKF